MDGDDVVVAHGGGGLGLAGEALAGRAAGGQLWGQHLDGDDAVQLGVAGLEHDAHAAPADDLEHLVMVQPAQRLLCGRGQERQRLIPGDRLGLGAIDRTAGKAGRVGRRLQVMRAVASSRLGPAMAGVLRKVSALSLEREQRLNASPHHPVAGAGAIQKAGTVGGIVFVDGGQKNSAFGHGENSPAELLPKDNAGTSRQSRQELFEFAVLAFTRPHGPAALNASTARRHSLTTARSLPQQGDSLVRACEIPT